MPMQNRIVESLRALADGCEDGTDSADQSEQILSQKIIVSTALLRNMSQSMNLKKEVQEVQLPKLLTPLCVRFERDSKALIDCYKATVLPHLDPLLKTFPASFRSFKSKLESSLIKLFDSTIYGRETYVLCASCLIALSVDRKGNIDSDSMANIVGILMERYQALFGQICTWVEGGE
ncbi:hypothetical protein HK102_010653 [Quaeritorhiza haematococci]|nr:hypothetical protein HK102_010653 [Quaeritorhiza haematococci]